LIPIEALLRTPVLRLSGRAEHVQIFPEDLVGDDGIKKEKSLDTCLRRYDGYVFYLLF